MIIVTNEKRAPPSQPFGHVPCTGVAVSGEHDYLFDARTFERQLSESDLLFTSHAPESQPEQ
jgi:hypothetical protein